ncbi:MAG: BMP family lipoprotein [Eubacteriales bacterium]|jgi:basic membrane protein A
MKKLFSILSVILILTMILAGCDSSAPASNQNEGKSNDEISVAVVFGLGGLGDKAFNDSAYAGIKRAEDELGIKVQYVEPKEIAEFEGHHREFAKSGSYDLIVGVGFDQADAIKAVGEEFSDQKFVLLDGELDMPNVASITFKDNEKTYLVGTIAGLTTKTNKIGIVGGMDIPLINSIIAGYKAGAMSVNKDVEVLVKYVGAWNDSNTGKELAMSMYNEGADIVMGAAGGSGLGVFVAAKDTGNLAIGADVNQIPIDPSCIFLSALRNLDVCIYNEIKDVKEGTFTAGMKKLGLKEDAVDYTVEGAQVETPEDVLQKAEDARKAIIDGTIVPPTTLEEVDSFIAGLK